MKFDRTEEQQQLAASIDRFIQRDYDFAVRTKIVASADGWRREVWKTMAALGLLGLPLPPNSAALAEGRSIRWA